MGVNVSFYFGNAAVDQVRGTGWFIGQFVPPELGPRHQTEVELKWAVHPKGERRRHGAESKCHDNLGADPREASYDIRGRWDPACCHPAKTGRLRHLPTGNRAFLGGARR